MSEAPARGRAVGIRCALVLDEPAAQRLRDDLEDEGVEVVGTLAPHVLAGGLAGGDPGHAAAAWALLSGADVLVLRATRETLTRQVVAACDRAAVRIIPLTDGSGEERAARRLGLSGTVGATTDAAGLARAIGGGTVALGPPPEPTRGQVIAVWGPAGSPGRSTIASSLAIELARGGRRVGLVDADTHAPSIALALGLPDEGPGFAAACRQVELGGLDARELSRISVPVPTGVGSVDALVGINRPARWPELSESRVAAALSACRTWADHTVVDVAASLERDEEIMSDIEAPRRNAAALATLREADLVVAVAAADPVGIARFLRGHADLRALCGTTPVIVVANRLRPGGLGIDGRGQVRRTLERFAGIDDVVFVPDDPRAVDAAVLAARPVVGVAPRSPFTFGVRRLAAAVVGPGAASAPAPARRRRGRTVLAGRTA